MKPEPRHLLATLKRELTYALCALPLTLACNGPAPAAPLVSAAPAPVLPSGVSKSSPAGASQQSAATSPAPSPPLPALEQRVQLRERFNELMIARVSAAKRELISCDEQWGEGSEQSATCAEAVEQARIEPLERAMEALKRFDQAATEQCRQRPLDAQLDCELEVVWRYTVPFQAQCPAGTEEAESLCSVELALDSLTGASGP